MAMRFVPRRERGRYVVIGQLYHSRDEVLSYFRATSASIEALQRDVSALPDGSPPDQRWRDAFAAVRHEWTLLLDDTCEAEGADPCASLRGGMGGVAWTGAMDRARELADRVNVLRAEFRGATGREPSGSDAPRAGATSPSAAPASGGVGWGTVIFGAALGLVLGGAAGLAVGAVLATETGAVTGAVLRGWNAPRDEDGEPDEES